MHLSFLSLKSRKGQGSASTSILQLRINFAKLKNFRCVGRNFFLVVRFKYSSTIPDLMYKNEKVFVSYGYVMEIITLNISV